MGILWACEIKTVTQLTMVKVTREYLICIIIYLGVIKLRMEMWNVSKRQQPDHRKKTTAEDHQQVFNVAINSRTQSRPSAGP